MVPGRLGCASSRVHWAGVWQFGTLSHCLDAQTSCVIWYLGMRVGGSAAVRSGCRWARVREQPQSPGRCVAVWLTAWTPTQRLDRTGACRGWADGREVIGHAAAQCPGVWGRERGRGCDRVHEQPRSLGCCVVIGRVVCWVAGGALSAVVCAVWPAVLPSCWSIGPVEGNAADFSREPSAFVRGMLSATP